MKRSFSSSLGGCEVNFPALPTGDMQLEENHNYRSPKSALRPAAASFCHQGKHSKVRDLRVLSLPPLPNFVTAWLLNANETSLNANETSLMAAVRNLCRQFPFREARRSPSACRRLMICLLVFSKFEFSLVIFSVYCRQKIGIDEQQTWSRRLPSSLYHVFPDQ